MYLYLCIYIYVSEFIYLYSCIFINIYLYLCICIYVSIFKYLRFQDDLSCSLTKTHTQFRWPNFRFILASSGSENNIFIKSFYISIFIYLYLCIYNLYLCIFIFIAITFLFLKKVHYTSIYRIGKIWLTRFLIHTHV